MKRAEKSENQQPDRETKVSTFTSTDEFRRELLEFVSTTNYSVSGFIRQAVEEKIERMEAERAAKKHNPAIPAPMSERVSSANKAGDQEESRAAGEQETATRRKRK
jgi:hypothetical protein